MHLIIKIYIVFTMAYLPYSLIIIIGLFIKKSDNEREIQNLKDLRDYDKIDYDKHEYEHRKEIERLTEQNEIDKKLFVNLELQYKNLQTKYEFLDNLHHCYKTNTDEAIKHKNKQIEQLTKKLL